MVFVLKYFKTILIKKETIKQPREKILPLLKEYFKNVIFKLKNVKIKPNLQIHVSHLELLPKKRMPETRPQGIPKCHIYTDRQSMAQKQFKICWREEWAKRAQHQLLESSSRL